jgi:hypothetical protein
MQSTTPTPESVSTHRNAAAPLVDDLSVYHDVGIDTEGRAHFLAAEPHEIIVTETDRRGQGVRNGDVVETIPLSEKTVDDYCRYVADEADCSWLECNWNHEVA